LRSSAAQCVERLADDGARLGRFDLDVAEGCRHRSLGLIARQIDMKTVVKSDLIPAKDGAP
jgi:NitT/TauT family transport system substrate-binding protein